METAWAPNIGVCRLLYGHSTFHPCLHFALCVPAHILYICKDIGIHRIPRHCLTQVESCALALYNCTDTLYWSPRCPSSCASCSASCFPHLILPAALIWLGLRGSRHNRSLLGTGYARWCGGLDERGLTQPLEADVNASARWATSANCGNGCTVRGNARVSNQMATRLVVRGKG